MPEHQQIQQSKKPNSIFQNQATPIRQTPVSNPYSIIQRAKINPKSLTHADVMQLQRTIGNRAVVQLLSSIVNSSTSQQAIVQRQEISEKEEVCPSCVQKQEITDEEELLQGKMLGTIQRQEIPEEEESLQGKFAEPIQCQEIPEEEEPLQGKMIGTVQRQEIPEEEEPLQRKMIKTIQRQEIPEEEEPLQGKFKDKPEIACPSCFVAPIVQRQEIPEEEETLQGKTIETIQRQEIPEEEEPLQGRFKEPIQLQEISEEEKPLQGEFESIQCQEIPEEEELLQPKRENNTGMPDNLKAGVESLSGIDMSDVRVHYNSDKPAEVGALAYTQGTNIHVASGQEKHLPHEAWHFIQKKQGRVQTIMQMKDGVPVNDDEGLEREADEMGEYANSSIGNDFTQRTRKYTLHKQISVIQRSKHKKKGRKKEEEPKTKRKNIDPLSAVTRLYGSRTFPIAREGEKSGLHYETYDEPRLFWRGDDRPYSEVLKTGFTSKNERDNLTLQKRNIIKWRVGNNQDDVDPDSGVCVSADVRGAAFFPLDKNAKYIYAVGLSNAVNSYAIQKDIEMHDAGLEKEEPSRYPYDPAEKSTEKHSSIWQYKEYVTHRIVAQEMIACYEIERQEYLSSDVKKTSAGIRFKLTPVWVNNFLPKAFKSALSKAQLVAGEYSSLYPSNPDQYISYDGIIESRGSRPETAEGAREKYENGEVRQVSPLVGKSREDVYDEDLYDKKRKKQRAKNRAKKRRKKFKRR